MKTPPMCPRCDRAVQPPGLWSSAWRCDVHGDVPPLVGSLPLAPDGVAAIVRLARVPVWVPHPMMTGWVITGLGYAGDERDGARATVVCCSGPSPLGGPSDVVIVAEEPGVGLGSRFAGLPGPDPGELGDVRPDSKVVANGHPTPLWPTVTEPDRTALVGEADGIWLWVITWPADSALLFADQICFADARSTGPASYSQLGYGAVSPRMPITAADPR